jgi:hypothetical protein
MEASAVAGDAAGVASRLTDLELAFGRLREAMVAFGDETGPNAGTEP